MAEDELVDELAREYPTFRIWRAHRADGRPGDLMATRRRSLTDAELAAGLALTLPMGFHGDLRQQLAAQAVVESDLQERGL